MRRAQKNISDVEWLSRYLARLADAGYRYLSLTTAVAGTEVAALRDAIGDDREAAADRELVGWAERPNLQ